MSSWPPLTHQDVTDKVNSLSTSKADLVGGVVPDAQIPDGIARDSEVAAAVSAAVSALVNGAPSALDTLNELAAQLATDESAASALTTALANEVTNRTAGDSARVLKAGDSMTGDLAMGGHRVTGLADPAAAQDAATRAYVLAQITALVNGAPGILDTLGEIAAALQSDESAAAALSATVALKAPLASPALTGTPTKNGSPVQSLADVAGAYAPRSSAPSTITYNTDGTVATVTESDTGAVVTYTYNADGTPATEARVLGGVTTTRTFTYTSGNLTAVA